jgi:small subunit ribosomal protein S33
MFAYVIDRDYYPCYQPLLHVCVLSRRQRNMSAITVAPSRVAALKQLRCSLFQTSYNPRGLRTGAKYFRARLKGPSVMSYYPQSFDISQIARQHPELEMVNDDEEERLQDVLERRKRGKGPPKKAKSKGHCSCHCFLLVSC